MRTLGRREKCLRNRSKKRASREVACPPDAKLVSPGAVWKHRGPNPTKTLPRKSVRSIQRVRLATT
jgi:hypothetical protein